MLFNNRHDFFEYLNMTAHIDFNDTVTNNTQNSLLNNNHFFNEIFIKHIFKDCEWQLYKNSC